MCQENKQMRSDSKVKTFWKWMMANVIKPVKDIPGAYLCRRETAVLPRPNLWGTTGENIPVRSVLPSVQKNKDTD